MSFAPCVVISQLGYPRDGGGTDTGYFLDGVIDEVALYDTALSTDRVLAHWAAGAGP